MKLYIGCADRTTVRGAFDMVQLTAVADDMRYRWFGRSFDRPWLAKSWLVVGLVVVSSPLFAQVGSEQVPIPEQNPLRSPYEPSKATAVQSPTDRFNYVPSGDVLIINKKQEIESEASPVKSTRSTALPARVIGSMPRRERAAPLRVVGPAEPNNPDESWLRAQARLKADGDVAVAETKRKHRSSRIRSRWRKVRRRRMVRRRARQQRRTRIERWPSWAMAAMQPQN